MAALLTSKILTDSGTPTASADLETDATTKRRCQELGPTGGCRLLSVPLCGQLL